MFDLDKKIDDILENPSLCIRILLYFKNIPIIYYPLYTVYYILHFLWNIMCLLCHISVCLFYHNKETNISKIAMLEGPWGIGKTYIFKHKIKPILELIGKRIVYVSLFGLKDIEEVKTKLVDEYVNKRLLTIGRILGICSIVFICAYSFLFFCCKDNLYLTFNCKDVFIMYFIKNNTLTFFFWGAIAYLFLAFLGIFPLQSIVSMLLNKYIGSGLPLQKVEMNHLYNSNTTIFVFDDLERIANETKIKEILGFINLLRENYNFNIIVISNEDELKNSSEYEYIKEKISFTKHIIKYNPDIYQHIVKKENETIKYFMNKIVLPLCGKEEHQTENLRIILNFIDSTKLALNYIDFKNDIVIYERDGLENNIQSLIISNSNKKIFFDYNIICDIYRLFKDAYHRIRIAKKEYKGQSLDIADKEIKGNPHLFPELSEIKTHLKIEEKTKLEALLDYAKNLNENISDSTFKQYIEAIKNSVNLATNFNHYEKILEVFSHTYLNSYIDDYQDFIENVISNSLQIGSYNEIYNTYFRISDYSSGKIGEIKQEVINKYIRSGNYTRLLEKYPAQYLEIIPFLISELKVLEINPEAFFNINIYEHYAPHFIITEIAKALSDNVNQIIQYKNFNLIKDCIKNFRDKLKPNELKYFDRNFYFKVNSDFESAGRR